MVALACAIGVGAGVGGLYLSYYAGIAAGAAVAGLLVGTAAVAHITRFSLVMLASWNSERSLRRWPAASSS